MLLSLALPIVLSAIALFVAGALSWMVSPLHKADWVKLDREGEFLDSVRGLGLKPGNYMFPAPPESGANSPEHQQKWAAGPRGLLTVFEKVNMGRNLACNFVFNLAVAFCLAYLSTLALPAGAGFSPVFRFVSTAAFMTFLAGIVPHAIWFQNRITGHVIESVLYAALTGAIFASLWPAGPLAP